MKRHKLIQRLTAALVAGAMALSFCAPALAEAPSAAADPAAPAATASTAENSTADTIVFDQLYLGTQEDWAKTIADGSSGDVALQPFSGLQPAFGCTFCNKKQHRQPFQGHLCCSMS